MKIDECKIKCFRQMIEIYKKLRCPNITKLLDYFEDEKQAIIITEIG